jgi:hypothetical protein
MSVLRSTKLRNEQVGEGQLISNVRLNPALLDVAFTGKPHSCSEAICEVIQEEFKFRDWQSLAITGNYKYVLDVSSDVQGLASSCGPSQAKPF